MDLKSLARASGVSRFWRSLVNDEHTWKVMCKKYKFRHYAVQPSRSQQALGLDTPDQSLQSLEALEGSTSSESELYQFHHHGISASEGSFDSNQVLSSLYETYIARGLDAASALSELKALHTLFLSKRAREMGVEERRRQLHALQNEGAFAHLLQDRTVLDRVGETSMSVEDKQFYQALEEFVQEKRDPSSFDYDPSNVGWLSTGPSSSRTVGGPPQTPTVAPSQEQPAPLTSVPPHHLNRSIVSPTGRLGSMTSGLLNSFWDRSGNASDSGHPPSSGDHGHSSEGHTDGDVEMQIDREAVLGEQSSHEGPEEAISQGSGPFASSASSLGKGRPSWQHTRGTPLRAATFAERGMSALGFNVGGGSFGSASSSSGIGSAPKRSVSTGFERANMSNPYRQSASRRSKPFSYKTHFKLAYLTESNWLRGGRLLTQHVTTEDATDAGGGGPVVTTLSIDDEWIVVGMANAKIHVFDARTGLFVKTLVGHSSGVWCLSLISASGNGTRAKGKGRQGMDEDMDQDTGGNGMSGLGAYPYDNDRPLYTPTPDLNLIHHDPRPTASTFSPEMSFNELPMNEGTSPPSARTNSSSPKLFKMPKVGESLPSWSTPSSFDRPSEVEDDSPPLPFGNGTTPNQSSRGAGLGSNFGSPCGSVQGYGNSGAIVVSGGCDRDVRVWDLVTGECLFVLSGHRSTVRCLRVLEGRPIAVSGARDGTLRVWNVQTGALIHMLAGHQHSVRCLDVAGNLVASASYDCTCRIWNVDTGKCVHVLRGHYHQIYAVAFDGVRIATGSLDSTVRVWSAETG